MRFRKSCINYGKCFDSAFEGEIGKFYLDSPNDEDPIQKNAKFVSSINLIRPQYD